MMKSKKKAVKVKEFDKRQDDRGWLRKLLDWFEESLDKYDTYMYDSFEE